MNFSYFELLLIVPYEAAALNKDKSISDKWILSSTPESVIARKAWWNV